MSATSSARTEKTSRSLAFPVECPPWEMQADLALCSRTYLTHILWRKFLFLRQSSWPHRGSSSLSKMLKTNFYYFTYLEMT